MPKRSRIASCQDADKFKEWIETDEERERGPGENDWHYGAQAADQVLTRALEFCKTLAPVERDQISMDAIFTQHVKVQLDYVKMHSVQEVKRISANPVKIEGDLDLSGSNIGLYNEYGTFDIKVEPDGGTWSIDGSLDVDLGTQQGATFAVEHA